MSDGDLLIERDGDGVASATLNRPDAMNALTMSLQQQLDDAISELESDGLTRCLILTGAGDRAFCAGYDLHEMAAWSADDLLLRLLEREQWVWHLAVTPLPIVVAVNGVAYGAGAILACAADVRVGGANSRFKFTAAAYGGANATWSLPALVGQGKASELLLTASPIEAGEAERIGLLNRVVGSGDVLDAARELASEIAANPAPGTRAVKRLLRDHAGRSIEDRFIAENLAMRTELRPQPISEVYRRGNGTFQPLAQPE